ncbi:centrosomal protein of 131 kDa isoform X1 [Synchiropus splendidus]|uniref:centrosomal protein of 131 kDa isoform X1 n=1 Tax=Synchiropus splendidus TaxID=270530 RepID=UPI00237E776A|nr:centrosomal protein of 131 kDa isoform X1 [Synchiropus splendidus]
MMHATRSPSSIPSAPPGGVLDLSLTGTSLAMSKRPSSASPGKYFSRSVSVATDGRGKRNTLSDSSFSGSRSIKNLRRSNSTTQVNQPTNVASSLDQNGDYLTVLDHSPDVSRLSKTSHDRTTWNILDDQPQVLHPHSSSHSSVDSPTSQKRREVGISLAASFTANNRSNKGAVGNSVTTILHNNYSEKPLTPKSSNQKPTFNNLLKASANDDVSLDHGSLTKYQKNFSSSSNNRSSVSAQASSPVLPQRREVSEEEAERYIQQVNRAAVTIQCWYRHQTQKRLRRSIATTRQDWEQQAQSAAPLEPLLHQKKKDDDRKQIREEKARLARLSAIQELQQNRSVLDQSAELELGNQSPLAFSSTRKPPRVSPTIRSPLFSANNSPVSPDHKAKNTDFQLNVVSSELLGFRAVSPALSNHLGSQGSREPTDNAEDFSGCPHQESDGILTRKEKTRLSPLTASQELQQQRVQLGASETEVENLRHSSLVHLRTPRFSPISQGPASPSNNSMMSSAEMKGKNNDSRAKGEVSELLDFRAVSPALSNHRGSQCSQRSAGVEEKPQVESPKTTLHDLLETLKLLEEVPQHPVESKKSPQEDKYSWIDQDGESNSLTTDNLERHGQLSRALVLSDGGALLSEAKLQSIMSFLDEMEKSEQERPRSVTSGSQREGVMSEEDLVCPELASATAAELSSSMTRIKLELEEKKRAVNMLQGALAQQRELTSRHVKETEKELNRSFLVQKKQYESTIQRHLSFIDQLISDKKVLSERCEAVMAELKQVDQKYTKKISHMQEQHDMVRILQTLLFTICPSVLIVCSSFSPVSGSVRLQVWQILGPLCEEIKKLKDLMSASEKIRREKWIDEKTKKIKEITVKGLEPEIQKLILKHKQEVKNLRTLHESELLQADERAAQRCLQQCEDLRREMQEEKEVLLQRERDTIKQRFEKQLQEEELSFQQQRRRLYKEVSEEKERLAQLAGRQRAELEQLRRQLEESSSVSGRVLREELDKNREELERRHQAEMKTLQERLEIHKQTWEENYKKKEETWLLNRERELREELRRERDKEIELAIWTLEEETSRDKDECERAADKRVKRVREKYEAELKEMELSEKETVERLQELRKLQLQTEGELIRLQNQLRQKEQDLDQVSQARDQLMSERSNLAEVIRQEFADRLVATEEENHRMKLEVSEVRARLKMEVERVTREKEEELAQVHQRVKSAILKKEEAVNNLRKQQEAAEKRADHLEALWDQQRRQLLKK